MTLILAPQLIVHPETAVIPAALVYQTAAVNATDLTTYTFSSQAFGTARSDRHIIVAVNGNLSGTASVTSVTIGGVTSTVVSQIASTNRSSGLYISAVPTGTTGDVVIVFGGTMQNCGISVYAAYNIDSPTPVDTAQVAVISATVTFPALTTDIDGIAVFELGGRSQLSTYTWASSTERYDATIESPDSHSGADITSTDGSSPSIVATASNSSTLSTGVGASWGPGPGPAFP